MNCIFQALSLRAMLFLSLLLLAAPSFRVMAYPNAEYLDLHNKQISSDHLLKPRDPQDSRLPLDVPSLDLSTLEQIPSSTDQGLNAGWKSSDRDQSTDYTNQDKNQNLVSPDLQAQACAAGPTSTNGKLRRGLSCAVPRPVNSTPQAPSRPKAPEEKPDTREDITPPSQPEAPKKPLPLLIDKNTGQIELDFGPEFAPAPEYESKGPCMLKKLLCCTGELPFPSGNIENCWPFNLMISFCLDQDYYYCCTYLNVAEHIGVTCNKAPFWVGAF